MFGLSFFEIVILVVVGIVVVGPKNLPTLMRTTGRWIAKLRRMSSDLRSQSGIDDLIRQEGLEKEIREIRALSQVNVIDSLVAPLAASATVTAPRPAATPAPAAKPEPLREREYPLVGCDAYGALADDAAIYVEPAAPAPAPAPAPAAAASPAPVAVAEAAPAAPEVEPALPTKPANGAATKEP